MSKLKDEVNNNNIKRYLLEKDNISPDKTAIFNIRKKQNGLYFDLKLYGNINKTIQNLLIPKQFCFQNKEGDDAIRIDMEKVLIFKYVLVYLAAFISVFVIIDGIRRVAPFVRNYFGI
jgi:hypothetical protein